MPDIPQAERDERWLPVVGYEDLYLVSSQGRVKNLHPRRRTTQPDGLLTQSIRAHGYRLVNLIKDGETKGRYVHILVLEAFAGPRPPGQEARHYYDPDPSQNALWNLCWGTKADQMEDRRRHGSMRNDTHFLCGHEVTEENTVWRKGYRYCRLCSNEYHAEYNRQYRKDNAELARKWDREGGRRRRTVQGKR